MWGREADELRERLGLAPTTRARLDVLDRVLLDHLARAESEGDATVMRASELAAAAGGGLRVADLADATGLGRRQLERRFLATVGIPPKMACRVARFRGAIARMHADPRADLSAVAFAAGYADQAHMTREFKALAGQTPGEYRRTRLSAP